MNLAFTLHETKTHLCLSVLATPKLTPWFQESIPEVPSSLTTSLMLEACNEISVHAMHSRNCMELQKSAMSFGQTKSTGTHHLEIE